MKDSDILIRVRLRCTGNTLSEFRVYCLADVPLVGDKVSLSETEEDCAILAEVVDREVCYMDEEGIRQVFYVCLTVVLPFEKWLYLWQDIVEAYQKCSDIKKALRKSDNFLCKNADTLSAEYLVHHHDTYEISSFGVFLLLHFIKARRKEEHEEIIE